MEDDFLGRKKPERRKALSQLLDISPQCSKAKVIQAGFLLEDQDFGGESSFTTLLLLLVMFLGVRKYLLLVMFLGVIKYAISSIFIAAAPLV